MNDSFVHGFVFLPAVKTRYEMTRTNTKVISVISCRLVDRYLSCGYEAAPWLHVVDTAHDF
jgi:hypothetical protein